MSEKPTVDAAPTATAEPAEWTSGIGGAQCDECYRTTIVQGFDEDFMGEATRYLCRPCAFGLWDDDWDDES